MGTRVAPSGGEWASRLRKRVKKPDALGNVQTSSPTKAKAKDTKRARPGLTEGASPLAKRGRKATSGTVKGSGDLWRGRLRGRPALQAQPMLSHHTELPPDGDMDLLAGAPATHASQISDHTSPTGAGIVDKGKGRLSEQASTPEKPCDQVTPTTNAEILSSSSQRTQPTILNLISLLNTHALEGDAEFVGVRKRNEEGQVSTELKIDHDYVSRYLELDANEAYAALETSSGTQNQARILQGLFDLYEPAPDSNAYELLLQMMNKLLEDPDCFSDQREFVRELQNVGDKLLTDGRVLANLHVSDILENTVDAYGIPVDSSAYKDIIHAIRYADSNPDASLSVKELQNIVKKLGEKIFRNRHQLAANLPPVSYAAREAPRMPTDCMMHWMAELEAQASQTDDARQSDVCLTLLNNAKRRWLQHALTFRDMRDYFHDVEKTCDDAGLDRLAQLARELRAQIPGPEHDNFDVDKEHLKFKAALNDNIYGRVFESSLMHALVNNPPQGVVATTNTLREWLAEFIGVGNAREDVRKELFKSMRSEFRSWYGLASTEFITYVHAKNDVELVDALAAFLGKQASTGVDCVAILYLMVAAILDFPSDEAPEWRHTSSDRYHRLLPLHRDRADNVRDAPEEFKAHAVARYTQGLISQAELDEAEQSAKEFEGFANRAAPKTRDGGITLLHQPPAFQSAGMEPSFKPATQVRPNFVHREEKHGMMIWIESAMRTCGHRLEQTEIENINAAISALGTTVDSGDTVAIGVAEKTLLDAIQPLDAVVRQEQPEIGGINETAVPEGSNRLPKALQGSLSHGVPFGTDLSGTTFLLLHAIDAAKKEGKTINVKDALIAIMMFLNYDGGHSLYECMGAANVIDGKEPGKLDLGLELGTGNPEAFVPNYEWLTTTEDAEDMSNILDRAFDETISYFRRHSYYAASEKNTGTKQAETASL